MNERNDDENEDGDADRWAYGTNRTRYVSMWHSRKRTYVGRQHTWKRRYVGMWHTWYTENMWVCNIHGRTDMWACGIHERQKIHGHAAYMGETHITDEICGACGTYERD